MNPTVWTIGVIMAATSAAAVSLTGLALLLYIAANQ